METFDDIQFMRDLERRFRDEFLIPDSDDRQTYKIYYSRLARSDFLFLGINPGGNPESRNNLSASNSYFEKGEHDFVRFKSSSEYSLAGPAFDLLGALVGNSSDSAIAGIPATNLCFWRSRDTANLPQDKPDHLNYIGEIVDYVDPKIIVLNSASGKQFERLARAARLEQPQLLMPEVVIPNGRNNTSLCRVLRVQSPKGAKLVVQVAHLSRYAGRREWLEARPSLRVAVEKFLSEQKP